MEWDVACVDPRVLRQLAGTPEPFLAVPADVHHRTGCCRSRAHRIGRHIGCAARGDGVGRPRFCYFLSRFCLYFVTAYILLLSPKFDHIYYQMNVIDC